MTPDEWIKLIVEIVYFTLSGLGVLVMVWGSIGSTIRFLGLKLRRRANFVMETDRIRMWLGSHLLLGLDLLIGADVVKTVGGAEWDKVGILGAIVVIRVVLSHFLIQEMDHARKVIEQAECATISIPEPEREA